MERREFMARGVGGVTIGGAAMLSHLAPRTVVAAQVQTGGDWPPRRKAIERSWLDLLGQFPREKCPLAATMRKVDYKDGIARYHVSFAAEAGDRVTAWLLVPDTAKKAGNPAVIRYVDYLQTLELVDAKRIGCVGHSLGGHVTAFAAAFEPRLAASCCNCGVLTWFTKLQDKYHWARPESSIIEGSSPAMALVYIKRFARYYKPDAEPVPIDFDSLMMLAAPRPLLIMACEPEVVDYRLAEKTAKAAEIYRRLGAGDRLMLFSFPGGHNYPPLAKRHSFNWFDRWLHHVPAIPTIWPQENV